MTTAARDVMYSMVQLYSGLGYCVIPLRADHKTPALAWKEYQRRRPSDDELQRWYLDEGHNIGIVTGDVSKLVVLDIDSADLYEQFVNQHNALSKTYTVRTARGFHLYFATSDTVQTLTAPLCSLLGQAHYVVAPPSTIQGHQYRQHPTGQNQPLVLSRARLDTIKNFVIDQQSTAATHLYPVDDDATATEALSDDKVSVRRRADELMVRINALHPADVTGYYQHIKNQGEGRNTSLFAAARLCRDASMPSSWTIQALAEYHAGQPGPLDHRAESEDRRYTEAVRTIQSAYSRPAKHRYRNDSRQLPTSAREKLNDLGQTAFCRVFDLLRLAGIAPGDEFSYTSASQFTRGIVGDFSLRKALKSGFFPLEPPLCPTGIAGSDKESKNYLADSLGRKNQQKPPEPTGGRPRTAYRMPTNGEICAILGVKWTPADNLTLDDLRSAKNYRQAMHREFIKRRPGLHRKSFLSRRLGVCQRTIDNYNRAIPVQTMTLYIDEPIRLENVAKVPNERIGGQFLEIETGKRYPPLRTIALMLLTKRHAVTLRKVDRCYYWVGNNAPDIRIHYGIHPEQERIDTEREKSNRFIEYWKRGQRPQGPDESTETSAQEAPENAPKETNRPPEQGRQYRKPYRQFRTPLTNDFDEFAAHDINKLISNLSIWSARAIVSKYGRDNARSCAKRVVGRHNVKNPAGLLQTMLKTEMRRK